MATKTTVESNCTVVLSPTEVTVVTFDKSYNYFHVRNDSSATVYMSVGDETVTANTDGVLSVPAGSAVCSNHAVPKQTIYIGTGSGNVTIVASVSAISPFRSLAQGGGGSSYTLPSAGVNTLGGIQAKPKTTENAECAVGADNKIYAPVPVKLTDLTNDAGFIGNTVDNLINYYNKSDTYSKTEVGTLISNLNSLSVLIVAELPTADISLTTIYLVQIPETTTYTQWMYISSTWANLGSTAVTLDGYYTAQQTNTLLDGKVDKIEGMGLSSNDFTDTLKDKLDGITAGANVNVIEGIKRNGTALPVTNKGVDIVVPEIDDAATTSTAKTWSIDKISEEIAASGGGGTGEENVIETVNINGTALIPDANKAVNITVPVVTKEKTTETTEVAIDPLTNQLYVPASSSGGGDVTQADLDALCAVCGYDVTSLGNQPNSINFWMQKAFFPASLTSVGNNVLYQAKCYSVYGGENLVTIGTVFCQSNISLVTVNLLALTTVDGDFCRSCTSLTDVTLPALENIIGIRFLDGCTALKNLDFGGRENAISVSAGTSNWLTTINSPNLTVESLVALGTALAPRAASPTATWTFNATAWNRLTAEQKALFTSKNYTVSTTT